MIHSFYGQHLEVASSITENSCLDTSRNTALHISAKYGLEDQFVSLLRSGCDVNAVNKFGDPPLHFAARFGRIQIVQVLLQFGARVNSANKEGDTALHRAVSFNQTEVVAVLIAAGANVNAANEDGDTPLHYAAFHGHTDIAVALIAVGANVHQLSKLGDTAVARARVARRGRDDVVEVLGAAEAQRRPEEWALSTFPWVAARLHLSWRRTAHHLFLPPFRAAVRAVLLCSQRRLASATRPSGCVPSDVWEDVLCLVGQSWLAPPPPGGRRRRAARAAVAAVALSYARTAGGGAFSDEEKREESKHGGDSGESAGPGSGCAMM